MRGAGLGPAQRVMLLGCVRPSPRLLATAPVEKRDDSFLIGNKGNTVDILRCSNEAELSEAAARFGHLAQVCVAGESNAGKSSLLNHLVGRRVARSSSVAGKTRTIDWICVNDGVVLTDLPGLPTRDGQTRHLWDENFEPLLHAYLGGGADLRAMLFVHDLRWRVSPTVRLFLDTVRDKELPTLLVMSKDDQMESHARRKELLARAKRRLGCTSATLHVHYSSTNETPQGRRSRRQLLRYIESIAQLPPGREPTAHFLASMAARRAGDGDGARQGPTDVPPVAKTPGPE